MHSTTHHNKTHPHIRDIASRLQGEINTILHKVDHKTIYSEFHDHELVDIEEGVEHDVAKESLDQRIRHNMTKRTHLQATTSASNSDSKVKKVLDFFFKPFEI
ncbi:MAG: hypothetical protein M3Q63_00230 [bacterium]|nr:hypothetical protein [bacterium]